MARDRRLLLPSSRSLASDVALLARQIPTARIDRTIDLRVTANQRAMVHPRISWTAIFLRAYGLVTDELPCLRQTFYTWPIAHLYEHATSVGMVAIHRDDSPAPRLCWGRFANPSQMTLIDVQTILDRYQSEPMGQAFRKQIWFSHLPRWLRRVIWWWLMNTSGRQRGRQLGTFGLSALAGQGVLNRDHPTLLTSGITYGAVDANGQALVTLLFDHRVLDGVQAARALRRLEEHLQWTIPDELSRLQRQAA